jgi:acetyltransferase
MVADHPELTELDINPLLCDAGGVIALDARVRLASGPARVPLAIRPYPQVFETHVTTGDGRRFVRPIRPDDEAALRAFAARLSEEDVRHGVLSDLRMRTHQAAARLSQIDYDRELTFLAWDQDAIGAMARALIDPDFETAECAVVTRADLRGRGLAEALIEVLLKALASQGVGAAVMNIPAENTVMLNLAKDLGFDIGASVAPATVRASRRLNPARHSP